MKLGIVTYNIAKDWDLATIIKVCESVGLAGVELRTTHAHGVEVTLSAAQRREVRERFAASPVVIVGLGSAFEYHSTDPEEVRRNIEGTQAYSQLAADVGAAGVKVRPNGLPSGVPIQKTIEQIGLSLRQVGAFAADLGVQIRLEVHGKDSCHVPYIQQMVAVADHPNVYVCWNSNPADLGPDGSIASNFERVRERLALVHINELWSTYPWREEFRLLQAAGYTGYALAEIAGCPDLDSSIRLLHFYKALWQELCRA